MRIAHASDTHNRPSLVKAVGDLDVDLILLTGDILGNKGRLPFVAGGWDSGPTYRINPAAERKYQRSWFRKVAKRWVPAFRGRPVVYVLGNHDFIDIAEWLLHYGHPADKLFHITEENPCVEVLGKRFAGFRQVNWITGEWIGETRNMKPHIERALACDPDVLVTHAPPGGILDEGDTQGFESYGIVALTPVLMYGSHRVTHHFFGHEHACGGQTKVEGGITFVNGACHLKVHEVP